MRTLSLWQPGCMDATNNCRCYRRRRIVYLRPNLSITLAADVGPMWVESGWDPIIPNLNAGEMCDAIISAMTKTDERDQVVDFTRAYYTSSQGVIGGDGAATISDVSDLNAAGTTIAVQSGTTSTYTPMRT